MGGRGRTRPDEVSFKAAQGAAPCPGGGSGDLGGAVVHERVQRVVLAKPQVVGWGALGAARLQVHSVERRIVGQEILTVLREELQDR